MRRTFYFLAASISVTMLGACASGPTYREVASTFPAVDKEHGRIFFLRDDSYVGSAVQPEIRLNGIVVGRSRPAGFFFVDEPPGQYTVSTATEIEEKISFDLAAGQTRYVRTAVSMGLLVGHVSPSLVWPDGAVAALQELHYVRDTQQTVGSTSTKTFVAPAATSVAAVGGEPTRRSTYAGTPVLLSSHSVWNRNCQSVTVPQIDIVQPPAHGRLEVTEGDVVIHDSGTHGCVGTTVHGILVSYAPDKGFSGIDEVRYTSSGAPGVVREAVIEVDGATPAQ